MINALNCNMPFDRFTIEQIGGDLLPNPSQDQLIATGFHRCTVSTNEAGSLPEELLFNAARDRVETTSWVWLGLTANCAVCHDHKMDPITQKDFYSMIVFFRNTTQGHFDGDFKDAAPVIRVPDSKDAARWDAIPKELEACNRAIEAKSAALVKMGQGWAEFVTVEGIRERLAAVGQVLSALNHVEGARDSTHKDKLRAIYIATDPEVIALKNRIVELEAEKARITAGMHVAYIQQEKPASKPMAAILFRGQYDQPREIVEPSGFSALHPFGNRAKNRLGLAQWIMDPANPLTSRVTVNRFWQEIFGVGIVRTSEDLGIMGDAPSHPALLDWLAVEFRDTGWDMKRLLRLIVTSSTYQQSDVVSVDAFERDPKNRLLSRAPRFRMDGEMVRDYALQVSGLLRAKVGGPSVKPYQPYGVWEVVKFGGASNTEKYQRDTGEALYRRSLYTFWKRSAPPASLNIFNAPSRETSCARRERTNTPLQALVTLNDVQYIEAARHLAGVALRESDASIHSVINGIASRVLLRRLSEPEHAILEESYRKFSAYYAAHPEDAKALISTGESAPDTTFVPMTLAAWTMVCNQLLNMDEVLNK